MRPAKGARPRARRPGARSSGTFMSGGGGAFARISGEMQNLRRTRPRPRRAPAHIRAVPSQAAGPLRAAGGAHRYSLM